MPEFTRFTETITKKQDKRVVNIMVKPTITDCTGSVWFTDLMLQEGDKVTGFVISTETFLEKYDGDDAKAGKRFYNGIVRSAATCVIFNLGSTAAGLDYKVFPIQAMAAGNISLRVRRDHVPYDVWERQGFLETTEGNVVHYGYIEKFIERLGERFNIREIAFDRWGAVQMVQNLEGMGFTVVPFGQGFKDMSPPTKELMKLTLEQKLAHGGHPVLRWMMDNIYIRTDPAGNVKADKEKSTEKIDGAVATIMGLDRAIRCGNNTGASVYDDRGILFI